jgi:hypothetical protein
MLVTASGLAKLAPAAGFLSSGIARASCWDRTALPTRPADGGLGLSAAETQAGVLAGPELRLSLALAPGSSAYAPVPPALASGGARRSRARLAVSVLDVPVREQVRQ